MSCKWWFFRQHQFLENVTKCMSEKHVNFVLGLFFLSSSFQILGLGCILMIFYPLSEPFAKQKQYGILRSILQRESENLSLNLMYFNWLSTLHYRQLINIYWNLLSLSVRDNTCFINFEWIDNTNYIITYTMIEHLLCAFSVVNTL